MKKNSLKFDAKNICDGQIWDQAKILDQVTIRSQAKFEVQSKDMSGQCGQARF